MSFLTCPISQTVVKFKGKNLKIKTPVCKALKKLHKLDDHPSSSSNVNNLPKEIVIELHPATNDSWLRVHSLAQNPRIRIRSPLQKRLSELIGYLERRWSTSRARNLIMVNHNRSSSPTMELEPEKLRVFIHSSLLDDLSGIVIKRVPLNFNSQIDLSLSAYLQKFHQNGKEIPEKRKKSVASLSSGSSSKAKSNEAITVNEAKDSSSSISNQSKDGEASKVKNSELKSDTEPDKVMDVDEKSNLPPIAETVRSLSMLKDMLDSANSEVVHEVETDTGTTASSSKHEEENNLNTRADFHDESSKLEAKNSNTILPLPPANATIGEWLGAFLANGHDNDSNNESSKEEESKGEPVKEKEKEKEKEKHSKISTNEPEANPVSSEDKYQTVSHEIGIDTLKKGWTTETTDLLVGELYLMMKNPEKIILEYDWIKKQEDDDYLEKTIDEIKSENTTQTVLDKLFTVASIALLNIKNQQIGGDTNLVLSPVKSKSYSRKNKRLKLGSPPPPSSQTQPSPSQSSSLLKLSSSPSSTTTLIAAAASSSLSQPQLTQVHSSSTINSSSSTMVQDRIVSDSLSSPNILSNLISDTILNDNIYSEISSSICVSSSSKPMERDYSTDPSSPPKIDPSQWFSNFQASSSPALKISTKPSKPVRCNDPALLQEAIKQLNSNKFNTRKQLRKPTPKPTFIAKSSVVSRCPPNVIGVTFPAGQATTNQIITSPSIINQVVKSVNPVLTSQLTGQTVQIPMVIPSSEGNIVVSQASVPASFLANPDSC